MSNSEDSVDDDISPTYSFFSEKRHISVHPTSSNTQNGNNAIELVDWRLRDRLKTVSVAIVLCLNIGIDPPDILKPDPCAKMEAWFDPFSMPPQKSLEVIGRNLQQQYEVWQPRARYRVAPDPSIEETRKLCCSLRRNAKEERILFHYNGHGVPKPTPGGELWVFNKNYTQYIPVSVFDLQSWLGSPCIFVYDCSNAGNIVLTFNRYAEQRDKEALQRSSTNDPNASSTPSSQNNLNNPSGHINNDNDSNANGGRTITPHPQSGINAPPSPSRQVKGARNGVNNERLRINAETSNEDLKNAQTQGAFKNIQDSQKVSSSSSSMANIPGNNINNASAVTGTTIVPPYTPFSECIQLAACGPNETLPMHPDLPADIFTCCLTTPIMMALRWLASKNPLLKHISPEMISKIPGRLNDRRTPLGELNWIFTAVTDTIAWNTLPHALFSKLFRQDLMVAALFRNFLLADRLMRYYKCTPMSVPKLPKTYNHSIWDAWDLAAELCLFQLNSLIESEEKGIPYEYKHSTFFAEQLSAFEVWLTKASSHYNNNNRAYTLFTHSNKSGSIQTAATCGQNNFASSIKREDYSTQPKHSIPNQLPIVLQVLLSQVHRLRALMLLSKFLDLGSWAVNLALSVGIFPYILKLLQSPAAELKPVLVFIWAKILAVDFSCQADLLKDSGFTYFINLLSANGNAAPPVPNLSEHRAMCAFILSVFCHKFRQGQQACIKNDLVSCLILYMNDPDPLLRQWSCICLGKLYEGYAEAKWLLLKDNVQEKILHLLFDPFPEVRAACIYSIGLLLGDIEKGDQIMTLEADIIMSLLMSRNDGSPLVRKELVHVISLFVTEYTVKFVTAAYELFEEEKRKKYYTNKKKEAVLAKKQTNILGITLRRKAYYDEKPKFIGNSTARIPGRNSVYSLVWKVLLNFSMDPYPEVANVASHIVDGIHAKMLISPLMDHITPLILEEDEEDLKLTSKTNTNNEESNLNVQEKLHLENLSSSSSFAVFANSNSTQPSDENKTNWTSTLTKSIRHLILSGDNVTSKTTANSTSTDTSTALMIVSSTHPRQSTPETRTISLRPNGRPSTASISSISQPQTCNIQKPTSSSNSTVMVFENLQDLHFPSTFYSWSTEYFAEPQMKIPEVDDPGSIAFTEKLWRKQRNEQVLDEYADKASKLEDLELELALGYKSSAVRHPVFHHFEDHLLFQDERNSVVVLDWRSRHVLNSIDHFKSNICHLNLINEDDLGLLMVMTDNGDLSVIKNYESHQDQHQVSAFKCFTPKKMVDYADHSASGTSTTSSLSKFKAFSDWSQSTGQFVCTTNQPGAAINLWDLDHEMLVQDMMVIAKQDPSTTLSSSNTTTNTSTNMVSSLNTGIVTTAFAMDKWTSHLIAVGTYEGEIHILDFRTGKVSLTSNDKILDVGAGKTPSTRATGSKGVNMSSVLSLQFRNNINDLYCFTKDNQLKIWDIRFSTVRKMDLDDCGELISTAFHEFSPVFARLTQDYRLIVQSNTHTLYDTPIKDHLTSGLASYFTDSTITATGQDALCGNVVFHPNRLMACIGSEQGGLVLDRKWLSPK